MPAYTDIRVHREINVSSSFDYFVKVYYKHNGQRMSRDYWITGGALESLQNTGTVKVPRYVMHEVDAQLLDLMKSGRAKYYEYDRDGHKRYEDLRYYDPERVQGFIRRFEADQVK